MQINILPLIHAKSYFYETVQYGGGACQNIIETTNSKWSKGGAIAIARTPTLNGHKSCLVCQSHGTCLHMCFDS